MKARGTARAIQGGLACLGLLLAPATAAALSITRDAGPGDVTGMAGILTLAISGAAMSCQKSTFAAAVPNGTASVSGTLDFYQSCKDSLGSACTVATSGKTWALTVVTVLIAPVWLMSITTGNITIDCGNCMTATAAAGQTMSHTKVVGDLVAYDNSGTSLTATATVVYTGATGLCAAKGELTLTGVWSFAGASQITVM
jgi:hypothetical protein